MDFAELAVTDSRGALSSDFGLGKVGICRGLAGGPPLLWVFTDVELLKPVEQQLRLPLGSLG